MRQPLLIIFLLSALLGCKQSQTVKLTGELKKWHNVTLEIPGPESSENGEINPFLDYRLEVTFTNGDNMFTVPGYFAADGNASETGATSGNTWKVHFTPNTTGTWQYKVSFMAGKNIAIAGQPESEEQLPIHGTQGDFNITASDKEGRDFRAKGRLVYDGHRYLKHAETGEYFLKGGADSPENFLGYVDFDGTYYGGNREHR